MTMNFKSYVRTGVATALLSALLFPAAVFAQGTTTPRAGVNACARIEEFSAKMTERLANQDTKYQTRVTERTTKLAEQRAKREQQLAEQRTKWDANRATNLEKLDARATTDAQKAAVAAFNRMDMSSPYVPS